MSFDVSIYINSMYLRLYFGKLKNYCESTKLSDEIEEINVVLIQSSGDTADKLKKINAELQTLVREFQNLMVNTRDFINDAATTFPEVDSDIAKQIIKILN